MLGTLSAVAMMIAAPPPATTNPPTRDLLICKRQAITGTRFPSRICRLQSEWDKISERHRRDFKEVVDAPQGQSEWPGPRR